MPSFAKLFKSRDASSKKPSQPSANGITTPPKPVWSDAWARTRVDPDEVAELLSGCTHELKSRALDIPFLLLPFRPTSDPSAARSFVRNYFFPTEGRGKLRGENLVKELRLTEPMVLSSVMKWCWSRLPGGVVTWEAYELFKIGEKDAQFARDAFTTFIPLSVQSEARKRIIFAFFELMAAVAAHGKSNGLGGRKLSRYAGWWAFEHYDTGKGFDVGYKGWARAADAASHLFFAYLRSMSPEAVRGTRAIIGLPLSLQQLEQATDYPPNATMQMFNGATKVVMIVDAVSSTPYALLRRAKNFEYRDDDRSLQHFANSDDPVQALTEECRRVLKCISSTNQSAVSTAKASTSLKAASWSRFEDVGFGATVEESDVEDGEWSMLGPTRQAHGVASQARSVNGDRGRPTTPSWADFLSSGFVDERRDQSTSLLPPDKVLPPIHANARGQSSQSHRRGDQPDSALEPGELASIDHLDLDDSFWWVWISSLAGEEPTSRKAVFGRCALIETLVPDGKWMIMEEQVKGAAPEPAPGAYIAEKKGFFGFTTKRGRLTRKKSSVKKSTPSNEPYPAADNDTAMHRTNIAPDQHARVQAAAAELQRRNQEETCLANAARRGRHQDSASNKTNSIMTLQPGVANEASQALKWASQYDKKEIRAKYLGDDLAGRGSTSDLAMINSPSPAPANESSVGLSEASRERELPPRPDHSPPASPREPEWNESSQTRIPLPPSPQQNPSSEENALPLTPSPSTPAATSENPPLPPTPPPSDKVMASAAPAPTAPAPTPPSPAPPSPTAAVSAAPEKTTESKTMPSEDVAPISPPTRSPGEDRSRTSEPSSPLPRKAVGSSLDHPKFAKNRNAGTKMKEMLGSKRTNKEGPAQPPSSPSDNVSPAAAAARAALAAKTPPETSGRPGQPASSPSMGQNLGSAQGKPQRSAITADRHMGQNSESQPGVPSEAISPARLKTRPDPRSEARSNAQTEVQSASQTHVRPPSDEVPPAQTVEHGGDISRTRPDSDHESVSRVDTNEQEQADREFSTFDQGPLLEQPAFVPPQSPDGPGPEMPLQQPPASRREPDASVDDSQTYSDDQGAELTKKPSPVQDRWAQIRKNAAERMTRKSEEQGRPSEVKTDHSEPSGEESMESRVARIKARVAELTGNMEGARR